MIEMYNVICSIIANLKEEGIDIKIKFEKDSGFIGLYIQYFNSKKS
jgi:hypothetical protein